MKTEGTETSSRIRQATCAGRFYPADPAELQDLVSTCLRHARPVAESSPKAIIAPHAGYVYSGPVAGSAYLPWRGSGDRIRRVVLLGPSHYVDFEGVALSSATAFATPLGVVPVDHDWTDAVRRLPQVRVMDSAHDPEHALEAQLPFLQTVLGKFSIVPLLVGAAGDQEVSEVLEPLWGGPETRVVVSSDLSHYHDYLTALAVDAATAQAIERLEGEFIDGDHACGSRAIRGLIGLARRHGLGATAIDLRNSGDTAGPRDRVVGYGAFLFAERHDSRSYPKAAHRVALRGYEPANDPNLSARQAPRGPVIPIGRAGSDGSSTGGGPSPVGVQSCGRARQNLSR